MTKLGPKEQQRRQMRESATAAKPRAEARQPLPETAVNDAESGKSAEASEQEESAMRKTTKATRAKTRTRVKPSAKTKGAPKSKVEVIARLLRRPKGCTTADVLKATKWPSVSMPQQAEAAGLKLRKEKDGKVTRYYAA